MEETQRNRIIAAGLLAAAILVAGWASLTVLNASHYEKYRIQGDLDAEFCERHYAACTCYGSLQVQESYPEQFDCGGYEVCHPVNRTVCP